MQIQSPKTQLHVRTRVQAAGWTKCLPNDSNCYVFGTNDEIRGGPYAFNYCQTQVSNAKNKGMTYTCYKASR